MRASVMVTGRVRWMAMAAALVPRMAAAQVADAGATDGVPDDAQHPAALDVAFRVGVISRDLTYNDDLFGQLATYELNGAPTLEGRTQVYPGAFDAPERWFANLGVEAAAGGLVGADSERSDGESIQTRSGWWFAGPRGRLPLGAHELSLGVAVGRHVFSFGQSNAPPQGQPAEPQVPDVRYGFVRTGVGARLRIVGDFYAAPSAHYLWLVSTGEIEQQQWFPRSDAGGVEGELELGYALSSLELRLGMSYRRYFFSLNPEPGDPYVAGGALDQYLSSHLAVAWRM